MDDVAITRKELDLVGAIDVVQIAGIGTYDVIHIVIVCTRTEVMTLTGTGAGESCVVLLLQLSTGMKQDECRYARRLSLVVVIKTSKLSNM